MKSPEPALSCPYVDTLSRDAIDRQPGAHAVTTNQVYIGVSITLALAIGCQILGSKLRIPALLLLLPAGFIAGALTDDVNPNKLLGASFQPLVSLAVALIL